MSRGTAFAIEHTAIRNADRKLLQPLSAGCADCATLVERYHPMVLARTVDTTVDDASRYPNPEEVTPWAASDPLSRLRRYLVSIGAWDNAQEHAPAITRKRLAQAMRWRE